jgi:hypothetical protein
MTIRFEPTAMSQIAETFTFENVRLVSQAASYLLDAAESGALLR